MRTIRKYLTEEFEQAQLENLDKLRQDLKSDLLRQLESKLHGLETRLRQEVLSGTNAHPDVNNIRKAMI